MQFRWARLATLGVLKRKLFWNKGYGVIIYVHDVSNKILSYDSNYIVDMVTDQSLVTLAFLWEMLILGVNFYVCKSYRGGWAVGGAGALWQLIGLQKKFKSIKPSKKTMYHTFWYLVITAVLVVIYLQV